jgi:uroporphyrinogen decarboxylase
MNTISYQPDYSNLLSVLENKRPIRLPLYEHHIDPPFISKALGEDINPAGLKGNELIDYYRKVIGFWKNMTYDGFDFEAAICDILPGHGAILGGMAGPIQTRDDFNKYPWKEIPQIFKDTSSF